MKRKYKCVLSLIMAIVVLTTSTNAASALSYSASNSRSANGTVAQLMSFISDDTVEITNSTYEIYGNTTLTDKDFREIVNQGENKIYLHYRTNKDIDLPYDALLRIKTDSKIYSYEFIEKEATDSDSICIGITDFLLNHSEIINTDLSELGQEYDVAVASDVPTTFIDCVVEKEYVMRFDDKGYIVYHIAVSRYTVDSESIIFIVTINNSFVPGAVANKNNEEGYGKYKNQEGFVHMTVEQAYDANEEYYYGRRWGNIPYKKDYWPVNSPSVVTVTSSIQAGINLGYSFENGFSTEGVTIGIGSSRGASISYEYTKSITREDPALTAQVNSTNADMCEWYYTYSSDTAETHHQQTNYMFEISNSRNGMFVGDFRLKLDYKFIVDKGFWYAEKVNEGSVDLIVRAGEYKDIYDFCNGMI